MNVDGVSYYLSLMCIISLMHLYVEIVVYVNIVNIILENLFYNVIVFHIIVCK